MTFPALLFVDDDPMQLELACHLAEGAFPGARTSTTTDPISVCDLCLNHAFDCVLIDYRMPHMNGMECAQALRRLFPHLPIVLCTGGGDEMLAVHAIASGVSDYLPKARLTVASLRRSVTQAIQLSGQNRVIEEQRKEIENFAFALAHDFKQPIRQIRTFASLISESIRDGQISELDDYINFLSGAARRLGNLVDVMSQYTLLNKPPSIEIVDLDSVVAGVRASIEMYLDDRSGQLITAPAPVIRGNETLMHQALQNLIVNGLKYNKSATPTVRITSSIAGDQCLIAVEDNGIGMDGAHLEKIFDPLARLHSHAEYEGSGLGLALARKAIAAQHGKVWCTSIVGTGSVFFVRIPLATPSVSAVEYTD